MTSESEVPFTSCELVYRMKDLIKQKNSISMKNIKGFFCQFIKKMINVNGYFRTIINKLF